MRLEAYYFKRGDKGMEKTSKTYFTGNCEIRKGYFISLSLKQYQMYIMCENTFLSIEVIK